MTRQRALIYLIIFILEIVALLSVIPASSQEPGISSRIAHATTTTDPTSESALNDDLIHSLLKADDSIAELLHGIVGLIHSLLKADDSMKKFCNGDASLEMLPDGSSDIIGHCPQDPHSYQTP